MIAPPALAARSRCARAQGVHDQRHQRDLVRARRSNSDRRAEATLSRRDTGARFRRRPPVCRSIAPSQNQISANGSTAAATKAKSLTVEAVAAHGTAHGSLGGSHTLPTAILLPS